MTIEKTWYLYIIKCSDDTLYTGISIDVAKRIKRHNSGHGAKSIKGKLPVLLVYHEPHESHLSAARREREIKRWKRSQKLKLIEEKYSEPRGI